MIHLITTYNIVDRDKRSELVDAFEQVLQAMGMQKELTNQSTYFGSYRTIEDYARDLFNAVSRFTWQDDDEITIYYPKPTKNGDKYVADIGKHLFKSEGSTILNHLIIKR